MSNTVKKTKKRNAKEDAAFPDALKHYWHDCETGKVKRGTTYQEWRKAQGFPTSRIEVDVTNEKGGTIVERRYVDDALLGQKKKKLANLEN